MINAFKPLKEDLSIYTAFYYKNVYKARKNANLMEKIYITLLQCYAIELNFNKLFSCSTLRALVPYRQQLINRYITVLIDKGYVIEVLPIGGHKKRKDNKTHRKYTCTPLGRQKVFYLHDLMKRDIKRFKDTHKYTKPTPQKKDYYSKLGILNKGQSKY